MAGSLIQYQQAFTVFWEQAPKSMTIFYKDSFIFIIMKGGGLLKDGLIKSKNSQIKITNACSSQGKKLQKAGLGPKTGK